MTPEYRDYWLNFYTCVARSYDAKARLFIRLVGGTGDLHAIVRKQLEGRLEPRVLDMCCGTGLLTSEVAAILPHASQIKGIDLCPAMIEKARGRREPRLEFEVGDAGVTGLQSDSFDLAMIIAALHEMPRASRAAVLAEARRILKADGILVVGEHFAAGKFLSGWFQRLVFRVISKPPERATFRDLVRRGLHRELADAGFARVSVTVTKTRLFYFTVAALVS